MPKLEGVRKSTELVLESLTVLLDSCALALAPKLEGGVAEMDDIDSSVFTAIGRPVGLDEVVTFSEDLLCQLGWTASVHRAIQF